VSGPSSAPGLTLFTVRCFDSATPARLPPLNTDIFQVCVCVCVAPGPLLPLARATGPAGFATTRDSAITGPHRDSHER
jgi:hypothetical protein